ncbi:hypothetical protein L218DRAFT_870488 [Marasmius fiardii PR-910]|nr:hypothetical protein L218DRAFT_870488 [Marasmius fiardii PR-910]
MTQHQKTQGYVPSEHLPAVDTSVPSKHRVSNSTNLKTVILPRSSLPRFLSIAIVNTTLNKETCGLFYGTKVSGKYIATTLLIPKQHSTSDTCTLDEVHLITEFEQKQDLIRLGWILTHPTQSCFMTSMDLHSHCAFQLMFPEAFVVVCAPKSTPNFGIFRLTDPPGLVLIKNCKLRGTYHPHPNQPIYTEADNGHVQMKDAPVAIVDLRD